MKAVHTTMYGFSFVHFFVIFCLNFNLSFFYIYYYQFTSVIIFKRTILLLLILLVRLNSLQVGDLMKVINPQISNLTLQYEDFYARGLFANALEIAQKILGEANRTHSSEAKASAHIKLMHCYYSLGEIENAFEVILHFRVLCEGLKAEKTNYYLHMINSYIYDYEENYELAVNSSYNALNVATSLNENRAIALSRNMYSHVLLKNGQIKQAYESALTGYQFIKEHLSSNLLLVCHSQHILATTQIESGLLKDAYYILEELSKNPIIVYNKKERSRFYFAFATYFIKCTQYQEAISHFKKSEELAFKSNDTMLLKRIYKHYALIYGQLNNYKNAFIQMQNYAHLLEQTIKNNFSSKIKDLDFKHHAFQIERRANLDQLSGLYNRSYFEQASNKWLANAKENGTHICLIVFDVDNFKTINDTHGHLYGDEVIKHIGDCCKKLFHTENTICARYGGDEFVIILKDFELDTIREITHTLFNEITQTPIEVETVKFNISISMGVVSNDSFPSKRFTQLFRIADQALYAAKNQGKNQIVAMSNQTCQLS